jgi:hypothetical protein
LGLGKHIEAVWRFRLQLANLLELRDSFWEVSLVQQQSSQEKSGAGVAGELVDGGVESLLCAVVVSEAIEGHSEQAVAPLEARVELHGPAKALRDLFHSIFPDEHLSQEVLDISPLGVQFQPFAGQSFRHVRLAEIALESSQEEASAGVGDGLGLCLLRDRQQVIGSGRNSEFRKGVGLGL